MSTHKVILVNYSLGVSIPSVNVCGHSRVSYGFSRWSDKYRAHVCELPLEKYEAAIKDLSRNWHKARCHWIPYFVEAEEKVITAETNPALREIALGHARNLSRADLEALLNEFHVEHLPGTANPEHEMPTQRSLGEAILANARSDVPKVELHVDEHGLPTKFFALLKIAKTEGVNVEGIKGGAAVRDAILANRAKKAA